jgi:hypothetical protein
MIGQRAGDGALSARGGTIDGNYRPLLIPFRQHHFLGQGALL